MGLLGGLRMGGVIFLLASLAGGGWWLRHQLHVQEELKRLNQHLTEQNSLMTERITQMTTQFSVLSRVLSEQNHQQQLLEENSYAVRKQLHTVLAEDACASERVPDDVIRLQRESSGAAHALSN